MPSLRVVVFNDFLVGDHSHYHSTLLYGVVAPGIGVGTTQLLGEEINSLKNSKNDSVMGYPLPCTSHTSINVPLIPLPSL